ncbi:MAG TPA: CHAT domain-containing protein [Kofleriaceae bacterium]|nr:CHAT domain-containing protein [Kofleriaceae bacterium]
MTKHTILFLAANPQGGDRSGLDPQARRGALEQEASAIQRELKRSGYRDRFELVTRWAAEPHDLLRELRAQKPTVVHFSGHGGREGMFFQAADGEARVVSAAAIAETFGAAGGSVKLVVLSACYGEAVAGALLAHVDCVVGMSGVLSDEMARAFAIGLYGALGEQESVADAYQHGNAAISLEGLADTERPQLRVRAGANAARIVLAATAPTASVELPCPYPGMTPYSADDADHFHGRGAEIDELIGRLRAGEREIYVIGPSGSGKSSLVAAGVLPRLARGVAGLGPFVVRSMRPGERPAAQLRELIDASDSKVAPEDAIAALLGGRAFSSFVLILIDQLEELFTLADAGERDRFLRVLEALRATPRCVIVFTLRADFYGAFMESPLWTDRHGQISRIEVAPLRGRALHEAIVRPARELGVSVEPELIERLLSDVGAEPGILPLLQETLVQLWDRRQGERLTLADYQALGDRDRSGLAVALSRRADAVLRDLSRPQEAMARRILLRLISFGEGCSDTRRQQPRAKLRAADDAVDGFDFVLQRLIDARLLTADEDDDGGEARVDLAHEVMITAWPTLAGWIQIHRAEEQRRRQLEAAAQQWLERGRGARGLLDPIELADAEAWQRTESARELGQSADVTALIAASRARHRRLRWLTRGISAGVFVLLTVIAATAISVARAQEQELQRDALRFNAYAAHALAGAVAFHLRQQIDTVVAVASDPAAARWLHDADHEELQRRRLETPFESFTLLDRSGVVISHAGGEGFRNLGKEYAWRDYFLGARRLGESGLRAGYISRVIRSEDDDLHKFGISAPIYDEGTWAGVLMATVGTDFALKRKHLDHATEVGPMAVVVAPRDRSRHSTEGAGEYVVILHERLAHGAGVPISSPRLNELRTPRRDSEQLRWIDPEPITDDAHRDPVPGYEGRWLAGFAPVGDTGFVVIVQTRYDAAVAPNARLWRRLAWWTGGALVVGIILCVAGVWLFWRGGRPHSGDAAAA